MRVVPVLFVASALILVEPSTGEPSLYESRQKKHKKHTKKAAQSVPAGHGGDDDQTGTEWEDNYDKVEHTPYNYDYDEAVDCVLGEWTGWTQCTILCGGGVMNRIRDVLVQQHGNGKACGQQTDVKNCNDQPCPVQCDYEWGGYGECSKSCGGGIQVNEPKINKHDEYGGTPCPDSKQRVCADYECPIDCEVSEWGEYSDCSEYCGWGVKSRERKVLTEPAYGGKACPYDYTQEENCFIKDCAVDCEYEYGEWSSCTVSCGGGYQTRKPIIKAESQYNGKACPEEEDRTCNTDHCAVECIVSPYGSWSKCSEDCGDGVMVRERSISQQPSYGGEACPNLSEETNCKYVECPIDCNYEWGAWSKCSRECGGGTKYKEAKITTMHAYGGHECPSKKEKSCNNKYCPVDCQMSEWGDWSTCSEPCGQGVQHRYREVDVMEAYGGKACGQQYEEENCQVDYCPIDCKHEWGDWSDCSVTCGGGYQKRKPKVTSIAQYGGKACPKKEEKACGTEYCPMDCYTSAWGSWSECNVECGGGVQYRKKEVYTEAGYGGKPCGETSEETNCNTQGCPKDCYGDWSDWGACDKTCGGGKKIRSIKVQVEQAYGGKECPEDEYEICSTEDCHEWGNVDKDFKNYQYDDDYDDNDDTIHHHEVHMKPVMVDDDDTIHHHQVHHHVHATAHDDDKYDYHVDDDKYGKEEKKKEAPTYEPTAAPYYPAPTPAQAVEYHIHVHHIKGHGKGAKMTSERSTDYKDLPPQLKNYAQKVLSATEDYDSSSQGGEKGSTYTTSTTSHHKKDHAKNGFAKEASYNPYGSIASTAKAFNVDGRTHRDHAHAYAHASFQASTAETSRSAGMGRLHGSSSSVQTTAGAGAGAGAVGGVVAVLVGVMLLALVVGMSKRAAQTVEIVEVTRNSNGLTPMGSGNGQLSCEPRLTLAHL